jgi:hypothetical protein
MSNSSTTPIHDAGEFFYAVGQSLALLRLQAEPLISP